MADSSTDGNRLYSILLDARASSVSANMYDIAERLVSNEKENAKTALEQLWSLKKNMLQDADPATIDMLIQYYQEKMDILRNREERIKRVSGDSRGLLEEKRKRDAEIANVKQEIGDCTGEIERLTEKLQKLRVKEQELTLIDAQLAKELQGNANEVVNGLYEIILSRQALTAEGGDTEPAEARPDVADDSARQSAARDEAPAAEAHKVEAVQAGAEPPPDDEPGLAGREDPFLTPAPDAEPAVNDDTETVVKLAEEAPPPVYPKSVVKTTRGRVIGEYYYDPEAYKNKRHYVYNSDFFAEQLALATKKLKHTGGAALHAETMQMVQDAQKRIGGHANLHFEISTNEILNEKTLREVQQHLRLRGYDEVLKFCGRLKAKINAMGINYAVLLKEQMDRFTPGR
jgi:hypothetical protein